MTQQCSPSGCESPGKHEELSGILLPFQPAVHRWNRSQEAENEANAPGGEAERWRETTLGPQ